MIDAISARWIDKSTAHRASSSTHLTEAAFQNVGRSDRLPVFFGKVIIGQALVKVFRQALDSSRFFNVPLVPPSLEAMDGFTSCGSCEDRLALAHEGLPIALLGLGLDVGHLVPDAALMRLIGKETLQCCLQSRVTIGSDEPETFAFEATVLQID